MELNQNERADWVRSIDLYSYIALWQVRHTKSKVQNFDISYTETIFEAAGGLFDCLSTKLKNSLGCLIVQ